MKTTRHNINQHKLRASSLSVQRSVTKNIRDNSGTTQAFPAHESYVGDNQYTSELHVYCVYVIV